MQCAGAVCFTDFQRLSALQKHVGAAVVSRPGFRRRERISSMLYCRKNVHFIKKKYDKVFWRPSRISIADLRVCVADDAHHAL
jgi:hypothetical protein